MPSKNYKKEKRELVEQFKEKLKKNVTFNLI